MRYPRAVQVDRLLRHLDVKNQIVVSTQPSGGQNYETSLISGDIEHLTIAEYSWFVKAKKIARLIPMVAKIPDLERLWALQASSYIFQTISPTSEDTLITFGQPMSDHLAGLRIKRKSRCTWVAHFSDPWSDNEFSRRRGLTKFLNRRLERKVIRTCDAVVFTSIETLNLVMRKYPQVYSRKSFVVPHSFESHLDDKAQSVSGPVRMRHIGNFYGHRTPQALFSALASIQASNPQILDQLVIDLVGNIPQRMLRSKEYRNIPEGLINLISTVSYKESLELMRTSEILIIIDAPADLSVFLPSKLVDYLTYDRPIIGFTPKGASLDLITKCGGYCADPTDSRAGADVLERAILLAKERRENSHKGWAPTEVRDFYSASNVASMFQKILEQARESA
jgi:glycosyltransferase involved in cell wall biosynthesis